MNIKLLSGFLIKQTGAKYWRATCKNFFRLFHFGFLNYFGNYLIKRKFLLTNYIKNKKKFSFKTQPPPAFGHLPFFKTTPPPSLRSLRRASRPAPPLFKKLTPPPSLRSGTSPFRGGESIDGIASVESLSCAPPSL